MEADFSAANPISLTKTLLLLTYNLCIVSLHPFETHGKCRFCPFIGKMPLSQQLNHRYPEVP